MSSTNKTANLKLHSWVRTDPVVCDDFNDNFNKLDAVVGNLNVSRGNCEIYAGTYTGTGAKSFSLTFPKCPVYLTVQRDKSNSSNYAAFVVDGGNFWAHGSNAKTNTFHVSGTTVTIQESQNDSDNGTININGVIYHYMAFAPAQ